MLENIEVNLPMQPQVVGKHFSSGLRLPTVTPCARPAQNHGYIINMGACDVGIHYII